MPYPMMTVKEICELGINLRSFEAKTADELCEQISKHLKDGSCKLNWVSFSEALADDCYEAKREKV